MKKAITISATLIALFSFGVFATESGYVSQILINNNSTAGVSFKLDRGTYVVNGTTNRYLLIDKDSKNLIALLLWASANHIQVNVELGTNVGDNTNVSSLYVMQSNGF